MKISKSWWQTDGTTDRPTDIHDLHIYATSRRIKRHCGKRNSIWKTLCFILVKFIYNMSNITKLNWFDWHLQNVLRKLLFVSFIQTLMRESFWSCWLLISFLMIIRSVIFILIILVCNSKIFKHYHESIYNTLVFV